jgi:hypothetical protein
MVFRGPTRPSVTVEIAGRKLPTDIWLRLPIRSEEALLAKAAIRYRVPNSEMTVAASGDRP